MTKLASFFMPITKVAPTAEGHRLVTGTVSTERVDLDGQIADYAWAKKEAQAWFDIANVREQHTRNAVGKGLDLQLDDANKVISLTAKVVDPVAVSKLDEGIYTGFSFGAKNVPGNPIKVVKDAAAPGGRIVGGKWVEISLADRPANPDAVLTIAKAAAGSDAETLPLETSGALAEITEADVEKVAEVVEPDVAKDDVVSSPTTPPIPPEALVSPGAAVSDTGTGDGTGDTSHDDSLSAARQAIRRLIVEEASESDPSDNDFQPLVDALYALNCFESVESFEYGPMVRQMAEITDKDTRRGLYKSVSEALKKAAEEYKAKAATPDVPKPEVVEIETQPVPAPTTEKVVEPDTEKFLTVESIKAVLPDQLKAMLPELLKEHKEVLKETLAEIFAPKAVEEKVEQLGKRAQPGGPVITDTVGLQRVEKSHAVNQVLEPGEVPVEALQELAQYVDMTKSEDITVAQSARRMVTKIKAKYGLAE
jgi:hypothetical protein